MMVACQHGTLEMVQYLVDQDLDINVKTKASDM